MTMCFCMQSKRTRFRKGKPHLMNNQKLNSDLFYHIFNSLTDMVFILQRENNGDYRYLFINETAYSLPGVEKGITGKLLSEVLSYKSYKIIKDKYDEAVEAGIPLHCEFKFPDSKNIKKINEVQFETKISPFFKDGFCTHIITVVKNKCLNQKEDKLKLSTNHFEHIINNTADAIYTFDRYENYTSINPAFEKLFGWKNEEILNNKFISIILDKDKSELKNYIMESIKKGHVLPLHEAQRITKKGNVIDVLASYSPLFDEKGHWDGGVAIYKDITDRKRLFNELKESEERYRLITEHTSDLIKIINPQGTVLYCSPSHFDVLGIRPDETINKPIFIGMHHDSMETFKLTIEKIISTRKPASIRFQRITRKGEFIWLHTIGSPILNNEGNKVDKILFVARNITERKKYEEQLQHYALVDHLTGQPNRRYFFSRLLDEMEKAKFSHSTLAVMMLDIDRFKHVNDSMGHDIGDQLLKEFAERVKDCLHENDILARIGGDEFAILLPDVKNNQAIVNVANRIINSLQVKWVIDEHQFNTTSSIGISFYPPYELNYKTLIKQADKALYQAKEGGRNCFKVYTNSEF